jgi:hypothetical protein
MNFSEKYDVAMLKIIIIIVGYTLNNFTTHFCDNSIIDNGKFNHFKFKKRIGVFEKKFKICFVNVKTEP